MLAILVGVSIIGVSLYYLLHCDFKHLAKFGLLTPKMVKLFLPKKLYGVSRSALLT